ncbi:hypothetical protein ACF0H5_011212 [Mactra antiquata]
MRRSLIKLIDIVPKTKSKEYDNSSKGLRGIYFAAAAFLGIGVTAYLTIYKPLFRDSERQNYKILQEIGRKDIDQSKVQPGDMKIWSNPYESPKSK